MATVKWKVNKAGQQFGTFAIVTEEGVWVARAASLELANQIVQAHNDPCSTLGIEDLSILTFAGYSKKAFMTANYPNRGSNIIYPSLALCGEAGELANVVKKMWRDRDGRMDEALRAMCMKEGGDCLWYLNEIAREAGGTLEQMAAMNNEKTLGRLARGTVGGSGENR